MRSFFRAFRRALGAVVLLLVFLVPTFVAWLFRADRLRRACIRRYYAWTLRWWAVHVVAEGTPDPARPLLIAANHTTYLDILVLGSLIDIGFIAKAEISRWPLIGLVARMCDVAFIERRASRTKDQLGSLRARLERGERLCLFPEGTTGDGIHLLPFKPAFFGAAEQPVAGEPVPVQPVSIAYTTLNHMPIPLRLRGRVAWQGNQPFSRHLWQFLQVAQLGVVVHFHTPLYFAAGEGRKDMARHAKRIIRHGLGSARRRELHR